jgi:hypothetical protein
LLEGGPLPAEYRGTVVGSVVSVWMPVVGSVTDDTPEPALITFLDRKARLSIAAGLIASQVLAVKVVCHNGVESGGKPAVLDATEHPTEHVSVAAELYPAVNVCDEDRYQNTVPAALVPLRVRVTGAVSVNITEPVRIWHGVELLHPAPIVCTVGEVSVAAKSASCDAFPTPPPPEPVVWLHVFAAAHKYTFCPAAALVLKNISPIEHVDGRVEPTFEGVVEGAPEKSTCLA